MIFGILLIVIEEDIDENSTSKLMPFTKRKKLPSSCEVYDIKSKFKDLKQPQRTTSQSYY